MSKKVSLEVTGKKFAVRCSSLPLLFSCSNALLNPDGLQPVRVENGFEELGTLIHAAIQRAVETGEYDFTEIEVRYPDEEVGRAKLLFENGLKLVEEARRDMKNPKFEVEVAFETEKFSITGHVDVLDIGRDAAYIVDFKTGRTRDDHYHQMAGYGVGAWTRAGRPDGFTAHIAYVYLETNEVTSFDMTADQMRDWIKRLDALPSQYTVNRRCVYCSLNNTCPTYRDYLKGSMEFLSDLKEDPSKLRKLDKPTLSRMALSLKMAAEAVERIRGAIKDHALKKGEDLDLGNGDKMTIVKQTHKVLLAPKALPILAKYITPKDLVQATKLSLGTLLSAAAKRGKGNMGAVLRQELERKLHKAGAIITTEQCQLRTVFAKDKRWPTTKKSPRK